MDMTPVTLSIAGSDCSAGAGLQADLKTAFALGCYPLTVVTCVVSEVPGHVDGIVPLGADFVARQLSECLRVFPVAAVKTGMLYSPETVRVVADLLPSNIPLVVDPVMVATAGDALMLDETLDAYERLLFPRATLMTPNLDEISRLSSSPRARSLSQMEEAARVLARRTACTILAKGGHLTGDSCTDLLCSPDGALQRFSHPRTTRVSTHGTGCPLSSAITAFLAQGSSLSQAVQRGINYTVAAIARSHSWNNVSALNHSVPSQRQDETSR